MNQTSAKSMIVGSLSGAAELEERGLHSVEPHQPRAVAVTQGIKSLLNSRLRRTCILFGNLQRAALILKF